MKMIKLSEADPQLLAQTWRLYEESFPVYEIRSRQAQMLAAHDESSQSMILTDEREELMAILFYWLTGDMVYVEFLAVNPALRGQNIGTTVLEQLSSIYPDKLVMLEIDPPVDEVSIRRLHFYQRLGFMETPYEYTHPSYRTGEEAHPHQLTILSQGRRITDAEFAQFNDFLNHVVLKYVD